MLVPMRGACGKICSAVQPLPRQGLQVFTLRYVTNQKHLWWAYALTASIGLICVTTLVPESELIQTIVDIVHSPAKARDGEQY